MIHCWRPLQNCYYGIGVNICNINFAIFDEVRFLKLTVVSAGRKTFKKNLFPYLHRFQLAYRLRIRDAKSPRRFLQRQTTGQPLVKPFRHYLQQSYKRLHGVSS
jgi:hypothetical protein